MNLDDTFCFKLDINRAMEKRLFISPQICQQSNNIIQIAFGFDGFIHIIAAGHQSVFSGGVLNDLPLLHTLNKPVIHPQRYAVFVGKLCKYRLFLC